MDIPAWQRNFKLITKTEVVDADDYVGDNEIAECGCHSRAGEPICCDERCINFATLTECVNCESTCQNMHMQKDKPAELDVLLVGGKGYGLFTLEPLRKGQFVAEYFGELISEEELLRRLKNSINEEHLYMMQLKHNAYIDARYKGAKTRHINHSCNPNCTVEVWNINGRFRVGVFAIKEVPANTELSFDYKWNPSNRKPTKCLCGSSNCRGYLEVFPDDTSPEDWERENNLNSRRGSWISKSEAMVLLAQVPEIENVENVDNTTQSFDIGLTLIGKRLKIWWEGNLAFFEVDVLEYDPITKRHNILYVEDSQTEKVNLFDAKCDWMYLDEQADEIAIKKKIRASPTVFDRGLNPESPLASLVKPSETPNSADKLKIAHFRPLVSNRKSDYVFVSASVVNAIYRARGVKNVADLMELNECSGIRFENTIHNVRDSVPTVVEIAFQSVSNILQSGFSLLKAVISIQERSSNLSNASVLAALHNEIVGKLLQDLSLDVILCKVIIIGGNIEVENCKSFLESVQLRHTLSYKALLDRERTSQQLQQSSGMTCNWIFEPQSNLDVLYDSSASKKILDFVLSLGNKRPSNGELKFGCTSKNISLMSLQLALSVSQLEFLRASSVCGVIYTGLTLMYRYLTSVDDKAVVNNIAIISACIMLTLKSKSEFKPKYLYQVIAVVYQQVFDRVLVTQEELAQIAKSPGNSSLSAYLTKTLALESSMIGKFGLDFFVLDLNNYFSAIFEENTIAMFMKMNETAELNESLDGMHCLNVPKKSIKRVRFLHNGNGLCALIAFLAPVEWQSFPMTVSILSAFFLGELLTVLVERLSLEGMYDAAVFTSDGFDVLKIAIDRLLQGNWAAVSECVLVFVEILEFYLTKTPAFENKLRMNRKTGVWLNQLTDNITWISRVAEVQKVNLRKLCKNSGSKGEIDCIIILAFIDQSWLGAAEKPGITRIKSYLLELLNNCNSLNKDSILFKMKSALDYSGLLSFKNGDVCSPKNAVSAYNLLRTPLRSLDNSLAPGCVVEAGLKNLSININNNLKSSLVSLKFDLGDMQNSNCCYLLGKFGGDSCEFSSKFLPRRKLLVKEFKKFEVSKENQIVDSVFTHSYGLAVSVAEELQLLQYIHYCAVSLQNKSGNTGCADNVMIPLFVVQLTQGKMMDLRREVSLNDHSVEYVEECHGNSQNSIMQDGPGYYLVFPSVFLPLNSFILQSHNFMKQTDKVLELTKSNTNSRMAQWCLSMVLHRLCVDLYDVIVHCVNCGVYFKYIIVEENIYVNHQGKLVFGSFSGASLVNNSPLSVSYGTGNLNVMHYGETMLTKAKSKIPDNLFIRPIDQDNGLKRKSREFSPQPLEDDIPAEEMDTDDLLLLNSELLRSTPKKVQVTEGDIERAASDGSNIDSFSLTSLRDDQTFVANEYFAKNLTFNTPLECLLGVNASPWSSAYVCGMMAVYILTGSSLFKCMDSTLKKLTDGKHNAKLFDGNKKQIKYLYSALGTPKASGFDMATFRAFPFASAFPEHVESVEGETVKKIDCKSKSPKILDSLFYDRRVLSDISEMSDNLDILSRMTNIVPEKRRLFNPSKFFTVMPEYDTPRDVNWHKNVEYNQLFTVVERIWISCANSEVAMKILDCDVEKKIKDKVVIKLAKYYTIL